MSDMDSRPATGLHPELIASPTGYVTWNTPDYRRQSFRAFRDIMRYGLTMRAPVVRVLGKDVDPRIGEFASVRSFTATEAFCALLVARRGTIVYERYAPDFPPDTLHSIQSITKTTMALAVGRLVEDGLLDTSRRVKHYLPEIGSGYAGATLQQVLDMDVVNDFSEDYADPEADAYHQERTFGWRLPSEGRPELPLHPFLMRITSRDIANPSRETHYKTANTDVLGWIVERVSGRSLRNILLEIVEAAGIADTLHVTTDREFRPWVGGGISMTARDLLRYGMLLADGGIGLSGERVGSPAFLDAARANPGTRRPNGTRYSNQLMTDGRWIGHGGYGGQWLAADPASGSVLCYFSVLETRSAVDADYRAAADAMSDEILAYLR